MHYNIWGWEERLHRSTGGGTETAGGRAHLHFHDLLMEHWNNCFTYDIYFIGPVVCIIIYGDGRRDCTEVRAAAQKPRAGGPTSIFMISLWSIGITASLTIFISLAL